MRELVRAVVLGILLGACGGADVGEECPEEETGSTDPCVDGAICDTEEDDTAVCLKVCDDDSDCGTDEQCTGVSRSNLKACHPDSDD